MDHGWVKSYRSKWTHPAFRNLLEAAMWAWLGAHKFADIHAFVLFEGGLKLFALKRRFVIGSVFRVAAGPLIEIFESVLPMGRQNLQTVNVEEFLERRLARVHWLKCDRFRRHSH